jgi:uncharacterized protein DUF5709
MAPRASRLVVVREDQLQPSETLDDRGVDDVLDEGYSPPDREPAHLRHPHEVDEPETLDERLAEEEPDGLPDPDHDNDADTSDTDGEDEVGLERAGRLMTQDQGSGKDEDAELWATDAGIDGAGASAEEAAMHVIDDDAAVDD